MSGDVDNANAGAGRFQRIEDTLTRIESKLDSKADSKVVDRLETRLDAIVTSGSMQARDALQATKELEKKVYALETSTVTSDAVAKALTQMEVNSRRLRMTTWGVIATAIGGIVNFIIWWVSHYVH